MEVPLFFSTEDGIDGIEDTAAQRGPWFEARASLRDTGRVPRPTWSELSGIRPAMWECLGHRVVVLVVNISLLMPATVGVVDGTYSGAVRKDYGMCTLLVGFLALGWAVPLAFSTLRTATSPGTGILDHLAGAQVADTVSSDALTALRRWRWATVCFAVGTCCFTTLSVCARIVPHALEQGNDYLAVSGAFMIPWAFALSTVMSPWFLSLKLACAIAFDDISRIIGAAADEAGATTPCSQAEWEERIRHPTLVLADITLPMVSKSSGDVLLAA
jgi:hypothetical protein